MMHFKSRSKAPCRRLIPKIKRSVQASRFREDHAERFTSSIVHVSVILAVTLAVTLSTAGCDSQKRNSNSGNAVGSQTAQTLPTTDATSYLQQVLSRYRNTRSYRDAGEVVLRIEKDGRRIRQIAPMQVTLDGNTVWVAAYDARLWSDVNHTLGWIANEKTNFHDSQVVVGASDPDRPANARPTLKYLLRDPVLTERMIAGLGGPPPQLEWLLDSDPMAKLFRNDASNINTKQAIEYKGISSRDGVSCVVVRAIADGDVYQFWIDRNKSLIHSVDLPVSMTGRQIELDGWTVHSLELRLTDASFQRPDKPLALAEQKHATLPQRPQYVSSIVPLPPPEPSSRLGSAAGPFRAVDPVNQNEVTHRGSGREFTLFVASQLEDSQTNAFQNYQSAANLVTWYNAAGKDIQNRVQLVALTGEASREVFSETGMLILDDEDSKLRDRLGIFAGQAGIVNSDGLLLWVGSPHLPGDTEAYSRVIVDSAAGIDVPSQMRKRSKLERNAYRQRIEQVSVELE